MKRIVSILLLFCTLGLADIPSKSIVRVTISPAHTVYYAFSFDDPYKFDLKHVEWNANSR